MKTKSGRDVSRIGIQGFAGSPFKGDLKALVDNPYNYNFFLTGKIQGILEEDLAPYIGKENREDYFIATSSKKRTASTFASDMDESLKGLETSYIDLVIFKNVSSFIDKMSLLNPSGALAKAREYKEEGKISYISIETHDDRILRELSGRDDIDFLVTDFNPLEADRLDFLKDLSQDMDLIITSPMAGRIKGLDRQVFSYSYPVDEFSHLVYSVKSEKDLASLNDFEKNQAEVSDQLVEDFKNIDYVACRQCGACIPCTVGMDIVKMIEINRRLKREDLSAIRELEAEEKTAYDCIKCGACEMRCPYKVQVRQIHMETVEMAERLKKSGD